MFRSTADDKVVKLQQTIQLAKQAIDWFTAAHYFCLSKECLCFKQNFSTITVYEKYRPLRFMKSYKI